MLHSPLLNPAKSDKVTDHHKLLCKYPQEQLPDGGIACTYEEKCRTGRKSEISEVFQLTIFGGTYPRPRQSKPIPQGRGIKNGDT